MVEAAGEATHLIVSAGLPVYVRSITKECSASANGNPVQYLNLVRDYLANTNPAMERKRRGY